MGKRRPMLTEAQILRWADAHHRRTGDWPTYRSGPIPEAAGDTWTAVAAELRHGVRGLPGGTSLARLLAEHRGRRTRVALPPLTEAQILAWADAHYERTGRWPGAHSGPVRGAPGKTWGATNLTLRGGYRGLPGGDSLARLLVRHGQRRSPWDRGEWTPDEDRLVRTLSSAAAARRTGRPLKAVYARRQRLRLPDARKNGGTPPCASGTD
jgi:hypothetical protein